MKDDVIIEIGGKQYKYSENRLRGDGKPHDIAAQEADIRKLLDTLKDAGKRRKETIYVDGVKTTIKAGLTKQERENTIRGIRYNVIPIRIDESRAEDGHMSIRAVYLKEALEAPVLGSSAQTDAAVAEAEQKQFQELCDCIERKQTKWGELIAMVEGNSKLGERWEGGFYNDAEELVLAAVDDICCIEQALNTGTYAGLRRVAEFMQIPYSRVLLFYTQHYILTEHEPAAPCCGYVPLNTLETWKRK